MNSRHRSSPSTRSTAINTSEQTATAMAGGCALLAARASGARRLLLLALAAEQRPRQYRSGRAKPRKLHFQRLDPVPGCLRTSSSSARWRMRRQGRCKSVRWEPGSFPAMTQGLSFSRGRADSTARASRPSGTTRPPVLVSGSSMQSSFTCSQRRNWISDNLTDPPSPNRRMNQRRPCQHRKTVCPSAASS